MVKARPGEIFTYAPRPAPLQHKIAELLQPSTVGAVGAGAAVALFPRLPDLASLGLVGPELLDRVPGRLYAAVAGFLVGWGAARGLEWLRWQLFRKLITYQGWIRNPKSTRTMLWGAIVGFLRGSPPYSTLHFQGAVPKQPLPDLNATLDTWLKVAELLISPEEFEYTKQAVEEFRVNEGPKLQQYLQKKAMEKTSWLADYWQSVAYLSGRLPIAINSSFYFSNSLPKEYVSDPVVRAATIVDNMMSFYELVHYNKLQPVLLRNLVPLCMYNYRYVFNTTRIPGEHMDTLECYPNERHVIVIRKGHYYKLDMYPPGPDGKPQRLTREELYNIFYQIKQEADALGLAKDYVAALTTQRRDTWKKHRDMLKVKNADVLHSVESSMFVVVLDDHDTEDRDELAHLCIAGSGYDRWYDKSFNAVIYENCLNSCTVEHSALDATVMSAFAEYFLISEEYEDGQVIKDPLHPPRQHLSPSKRLNWDVADMRDIIAEAVKQFQILKDNLEIVTSMAPYGKGAMKAKRVSPDGYIQMAMQLAYYRLHKEVPKTYEPATNRLFALGRTETVHPISKQSKQWVQIMDDPQVSNEEKIGLFKAAIKEQTHFRVNATMGKGCDRHLLGLYCASRELGMDVPKLFMDKPWYMPFKLSTSQTPSQLKEAGADLCWRDCCGGFGAVCEDGYGICYEFLGDDCITLHITAWNSCETTSAKKLTSAIAQAFEDIKMMWEK